MNLHFYILAGIGFFTVLYIAEGHTHKKVPSFDLILSYLLMLYVFAIITLYPVDSFSDKNSYLNAFNTIRFTDLNTGKDIGWYYYTYLFNSITTNSQAYFAFTAFIYVGGYYIFARKFIAPSYIFIFLLATFTSFAFFAYGVNTLRAGFALSFLLLAITYHRKVPFFLLFGVLAVLCHKSLTLPFLGFMLARYIKKPNYYLVLWIVALLFSSLNIVSISSFLESNMGDFDERAIGYLSKESTLRYKSGFRLDFVLYSLAPILVGYYYIFKLKIKDPIYTQLYCTYLFTNAFWLLVIRMNFTDRMAYLSWFLIPFLMLYPLIKYNLFINQRKYIALILTAIISFTLFMSIK